MRSSTVSLLCLLSLATLLGVNGGAGVAPTVVPRHDVSSFNRTLFPSTFVFGLGSSAYQVLIPTQQSLLFFFLPFNSYLNSSILFLYFNISYSFMPFYCIFSIIFRYINYSKFKVKV